MKEYAFSTRKLCYVALFTALNIILSSFGVPVPGGHLYMNDIVICLAALVFDPISAFIAEGLINADIFVIIVEETSTINKGR